MRNRYQNLLRNKSLTFGGHLTFRYQGEGKRRKGIRKGYAVMSPNRMMMANLAMNKKRTVGTMFTMGLSCVLFVVAVNYTRNVDIEYAARQELPFG